VNQQLRRVPDRAEKPIRSDCEFEFGFSFKAEPSRIGKARAVAGGFIQRCLQLEDKELIRVELVLEEALANAVYHGSLEISSDIRTGRQDRFNALLSQRLETSPYCDRQVQVQLAICDKDLRIVVTDDGPGFDVNATAGACDSEAVHRPSGRGLLLMHAFADSVKFNESGNSVQLIRKRSSMKSAVPQAAQQQTAIAAAVLPQVQD
jgi:anti-sigma regulatory factor (Ser/Thr protein kinase)